ncbi:alpha-hydroxy acid oxidase [Kribbella sp. NPDC050820]|uniref:alpha-hydroxy acid oxidase n=1 Tax=Kribbella sp. NPDC050820 TaxID=3155408 RepID=UPI0033D773CD
MFPRWRTLRHLLRFEPVVWSPTARQLDRAVTVGDLRAMARRRVPRSVFDYVDGAADRERGLARTRAVFENLEFRPRGLRDVSQPDLSVRVLGQRSSLPFAFAPTGFTRMMHHEGERAMARVAATRSIPYALSTLGTTTPEDVAAAAPDARRWFQLYVWKDRARSKDLVQRAKAAGFEALILTIDSAVVGMRRRDVRNGFAMPPALTVRTVLNAARYPRWWINFLTTEPLTFASLQSWNRPLAEIGNTLFDTTMSLDDLAWLRGLWDGPLVVKGVMSLEDVECLTAAGADALVLSTHGGRQLDLSPVPLRLLPQARDLVGDRVELWLDSGITTGADIVAAHALGANLTLLGRAPLYGLMAAGQSGVERAIDILTAETQRQMQLLGVRAITDLEPQHVMLPPQAGSC